MATALGNLELHTPAFIYDVRQLLSDCDHARSILKSGDTTLLFAIKAFCVPGGLKHIATLVDGFHASSLFEARLARQILGDSGVVHLTSPGIRPDEIREISEICDGIAFNSMSQWERFRPVAYGRLACGLRVNPQMSTVPDSRYDPCRRHSKLGVPLDPLHFIIQNAPERLAGITGLSIHTNCESRDFRHLLATVKHVFARLDEGFVAHMEWLNLGGGYLIDQKTDLAPLHETVAFIRSRCCARLIFEPGAALVRQAGFLVSTVLDIFESDGAAIAVLDTTINHMPEVFEYQFQPDIVGHDPGGRYKYLLAGSTCLAGDIFGDYAFSEPLKVGSRIIFENAGAYTLVKAHTFNGINLPTIYRLNETGEATLEKQYSFADFLARWGENDHVHS